MLLEARKLAITGGRVIDPAQGIDRIADVLISNGKIESVIDTSSGSAAVGYQKIDANGMIVSPGFVDLHTHLREAGGQVAVVAHESPPQRRHPRRACYSPERLARCGREKPRSGVCKCGCRNSLRSA